MAMATHSSSPASPITLADGSDQATRGAQVYALRCITCHGDRGQGLTPEWRLTWDPDHQNCGQPNCHGLNHPPEGFYLPNMYAPAIIGSGTLEGFQTAQNLFGFISMRMPFQAPGVLSREDYWALTAFLLRQNGITLPGAEVGESNASTILLHPRPVQPTAPAAPSTP
jgi:cytochrome c